MLGIKDLPSNSYPVLFLSTTRKRILCLLAFVLVGPSAQSHPFPLASGYPNMASGAGTELPVAAKEVRSDQACASEFSDTTDVFKAFVTHPLPPISDDRSQAFKYRRNCAIPGSSAYTFVGSAATDSPTTDYKNFPELSQTFRIYDYTAGFNADRANQNKGRSGAFVDVLRLYQGGQGDLVGHTFFGNVYSTKADATHFLAGPSIAVENGSIGAEASANGAYLQQSEYIFSDGGAAVSAIDRVRDYVRTNSGATLGQVWIHDRPQSTGPVPIDGFYVPYGKARRGIDTTGVELDTDNAAFVLSPGQRIYFGAFSKPDAIGAQFIAKDVGVASMYMNPHDGSIHISPGSGHSIVLDDLPELSTDLPSGALYMDHDRFIRAK